MRLAVGLLAFLSGFGIAPAFATDPTPPSPSPQAQQSATAPATTAPAAATPTASTATTATQSNASQATAPGAKSTDLTPQEKNLISSGYSLQIRKGEKFFCKSEASLGTRFTRKTCQTADQIFANTQRSKDQTSDIQRAYAPPPAGH